MPGLSTADHSTSPPRVSIPRDYNAAHDLIERNLAAGRAGKLAFVDDAGALTYGELAERVNRAANALTALGLQMEDRIVLAHLDTIDFVAVFLGAIKAGIVPVAVNTLLTAADYEYMLSDSRAKALVVSEALLPAFASLLDAEPIKLSFLKHVLVSGQFGHRHHRLADVMAKAGSKFETAPTTSDDVCFWLYSSGSTGAPKGTVHLHSHLIQTAELYAVPVLGLREDDVVFSAAKLFFAYGLGNALTFPMAVGASTILMAERPTPAAVFKRLNGGLHGVKQPTVFYGVPTLFAALLASPELPAKSALALRVCTSAGEALPADIGNRWTAHFGIEILDGIGSTEMLHIFLSNRPGEVRYGTTGKAVPGYDLRLVDETGATMSGTGQIGELQICGPSSAAGYWNNRAKTRATFMGDWTRSGDKYSVDADGYYTYAGRTDDMLKVGGIYVSPFEVEAALATHPAVLEAAVIGLPDEEQLIKPKAYVVLKPGQSVSEDELKAHVKSRLAPFKYPRNIEFVSELPKTATGKIQRFKLRARS
jgi:benzoate-CoA ligase